MAGRTVSDHKILEKLGSGIRRAEVFNRKEITGILGDADVFYAIKI
jgi:hypothetical protein